MNVTGVVVVSYPRRMDTSATLLWKPQILHVATSFQYNNILFYGCVKQVLFPVKMYWHQKIMQKN